MSEKLVDSATAMALSAIPTDIEPATSLFDSGASRHMTRAMDDFVDITLRHGTIEIAGDIRLPVDGIGTAWLRCKLPNGSIRLTELTNVLYSTELRHTRLFSQPYIRKKGFRIDATGDHLFSIDRDGIQVLQAKFHRGAMVIQTAGLDSALDEHSTGRIVATAGFASYDIFHHAIGHSIIKNPARSYEDGNVIPLKPSNFHCSGYHMSKSIHRRPVTLAARSKRSFELVYSDLSGKFSELSIGDFRYYISFIDDYSRYAWMRFLARKADAPKAIIEFVAFVETQFGKRVAELAVGALIKKF